MGILASKVGQIGLVSDMRSAFISRSVHARLHKLLLFGHLELDQPQTLTGLSRNSSPRFFPVASYRYI